MHFRCVRHPRHSGTSAVATLIDLLVLDHEPTTERALRSLAKSRD
ncbi:MAG: hypothetical protein ACJ757_04310 [Gaiellaceae bacterium]